MGDEGREGDWDCNRCNNRNYAFRSFCNRCKKSRLLVDTKTAAAAGGGREGDWVCSGCQNRNYPFRSLCNRCKQPRLLVDTKTAAAGGEREGDWDCSGCQNRNYPFRSLCNRCKQPRLLVDTKTPKWLGNWICSGCSNNNYASREKCKKCGQPKEEAAMPAIAMHGSSLPAYDFFLPRVEGVPGLKMNYQIPVNSSIQQPLLPPSGWSFGGLAKYGLQPMPNWPFDGASNTGYPHSANVPVVREGWRDGDWMCKCGFHSYSSHTECKECNAPMPPGASSAAVSSAVSTLGTKRLAPDDFVNGWDNKRLNAGYMNHHFLANEHQRPYQGFDQLAGSGSSMTPATYYKYLIGTSETATSFQGRVQSPQHAAMPVFIGKGAKQWLDGDWLCSQCDNHNYASRSDCNRCKMPKEPTAEPGSSAESGSSTEPGSSS